MARDFGKIAPWGATEGVGIGPERVGWSKRKMKRKRMAARKEYRRREQWMKHWVDNAFVSIEQYGDVAVVGDSFGIIEDWRFPDPSKTL